MFSGQDGELCHVEEEEEDHMEEDHEEGEEDSDHHAFPGMLAACSALASLNLCCGGLLWKTWYGSISWPLPQACCGRHGTSVHGSIS